MRGANIYICTDLQAREQVMKANRFEFKFVWESLNNVMQVVLTNKATLVWLSRHSRFKGNGMADKLVKQWASNHLYGPELILGVSKAQIKGELEQWERRKSLSFWKETSK